MGLDFEVLEVSLGESEEVDISEYATEPPLILLSQQGAAQHEVKRQT